MFSVALTVLTTEQVMHGLGQHSSQLDKKDLNILLKVGFSISFRLSVPSASAFRVVCGLSSNLPINEIRRYTGDRRRSCYGSDFLFQGSVKEPD